MENNVTVGIESDMSISPSISAELPLELAMARTLQNLTQKMDKATDGSKPVLSLTLDSKIRFKKGSPSGPPASMISLSLLRSLNDPRYRLSPIPTVMRSLNLNHLAYVDVIFPNWSDWSIFSDLPRLQELVVWTKHYSVLTALSHGLRSGTEQSTTETEPTLHPAFPALTRITIRKWDLGSNEGEGETVATRLLECVKLRTGANLPLERLTIADCVDVQDSILSDLGKFVVEVIKRESR
ncbi:hypothetical protein H0H92_009312 [Tricholoma furcatifolium]|nr:hypothetical protein H0H92_009312 [Tricholoma furcatifolium]